MGDDQLSSKFGRLAQIFFLCFTLVATSGCFAKSMHHLLFHAHCRQIDPQLELLRLREIAIDETEPDEAVKQVVREGMQELPDTEEDERPPLFPDAAELTLQDARAAALEGNLDLTVATFDPEIGRQRIYEEIWRFESTFEGTLNIQRTNNPPIPPEPEPELVTDRFDPAIVFPLFSGGRLAIRNDANRTHFPGSIPNLPNIHNLSPTLTYSQPLLRNAGFEVNTAPIQFAYLQLGRLEASTKLVAIRVVAATERAYWRLLGAQKNLEIAKQQVAIAKNQLSVAEKLADAGVVTRVEVLRSESGLNARREFVVRAEQAVLLATRDLKRIIQDPGLPVESTTAIKVKSEPNLLGLSFNRDLLVDRALVTRLELLDLELQLEQQTLNLQVRRNSVLPLLDFRFAGSLRGVGTTSGMAARQAWEEDYEDVSAGLSFSVPLAGNRSARRLVRESELEIARTATTRDQQTVLIVTQINDAVDGFEKSWERINIANKTVAVARDTYQAETRLFELGQRTSDLVLQAAFNLADAQQQLVQSVVDFQISRVDIAEATGTVLGYSGIELTNEIPEEIDVPDPVDPVEPDNLDDVDPLPSSDGVLEVPEEPGEPDEPSPASTVRIPNEGPSDELSWSIGYD